MGRIGKVAIAMREINYRVIISKKCKGDGSFIAALFVITTLLVITAFCLGVNKDYNRKAKLDDCVRSYALVAETQGGLTPSQKLQMRIDIAGITGVADEGHVYVSCPASGTTIYGNSMQIVVQVFGYERYTLNVLNKVTKFLDPSSSKKVNGGFLQITKYSTSKY